MKNRLTPYPLGAQVNHKEVVFRFACSKDKCGVILYHKHTGMEYKRYKFQEKNRIGDIWILKIKELDIENLSYSFYVGDDVIPDPYGRFFLSEKTYGTPKQESELKAGFYSCNFQWENDKPLEIPYYKSINYCMHVRGFTAHSSSKIKHKGTFLGVTEKIPYLKRLGITTIEFQPIYEFIETEQKASNSMFFAEQSEKINYWGYKKGFYYAPKASYAASKDVVNECKQMIKTLHENGLEAVLQFYFPRSVCFQDIIEILRFWSMEYHIDGFHLIGENLPAYEIARDPLLAKLKVWYYDFSAPVRYTDSNEQINSLAKLGIYKDDYLYAVRKYIKGDENMLNAVLYQMRHIAPEGFSINFISNYYGFTLADTFSYEHKHNESNGENNRDGSDYNYSWNCGEEGPTRKKKIIRLRKQLIKNALTILMFSASAPLIFMGDEFGNSQRGNNNPYCQDNEITWLNWKDLDKNREIFDFCRMLIDFRKSHPVLTPQKEPTLMDTISCGYPDLSYHGKNAWRAQTEMYYHHVGILYCGMYAKDKDEKQDDFIYLAINMYWEPNVLALPRLPKGKEWVKLFVTSEGNDKMSGDLYEGKADKLSESIKESQKEIPERSIIVYISRDEAAVKMNGKNNNKHERIHYEDRQNF